MVIAGGPASRRRIILVRMLQHNRSEQKYNSSTILKNEAPTNSPSNPPQLAAKSIGPYNSDRVNVINSFSLKDRWNGVGKYLKF